MNTFPKVSVVTTTYNDIENLKRILAEVKRQTYPNIEHIIVDGGSTDGTVDLLKAGPHFLDVGKGQWYLRCNQ